MLQVMQRHCFEELLYGHSSAPGYLAELEERVTWCEKFSKATQTYPLDLTKSKKSRGNEKPMNGQRIRCLWLLLLSKAQRARRLAGSWGSWHPTSRWWGWGPANCCLAARSRRKESRPRESGFQGSVRMHDAQDLKAPCGCGLL
jgi:hypothetical protein